MTKATLLLFNTERLIDLCPLRRVLDHNFTVFIDYVCSANPTIKKNKRKSKHCLKNNTTLRSLKGGQKCQYRCFPIDAIIIYSLYKGKVQNLLESLQCLGTQAARSDVRQLY